MSSLRDLFSFAAVVLLLAIVGQVICALNIGGAP